MSNNDKKIDKKNIKIFFEERAKTYDENNPLKSVIYQDKNPILAKERDLYEKTKIKKILNLSKDDTVLDIGCGIGRWASELYEKVNKYVGIDYMESFIEIAKEKYKKRNNVYFICLNGSDLNNSDIKFHSPYNLVMILGLYPYISNDEGYNILENILKISNNFTRIIIREPIALDKELILNNVWSDEMETHYSAVYRTQKYFEKMFGDVLFNEGYELSLSEPLFPNHLNNRKETRQHLFYLEKGDK